MEAVLTSTHDLCFRAKIRKKVYTPVNPSFTILKWGVRGSSLQGLVFVMIMFDPDVWGSTDYLLLLQIFSGDV